MLLAAGLTLAAQTPLQVGTHKTVDADMLRHAKWKSGVWRLDLKSEGAKALRVHFRGVTLSGPGKLWIRDEKGVRKGPYTGKGPNGDGEFWTESVFGARVTAEYEPGTRKVDKKASRPFEIVEFSERKAE